MKTFHVYIPEVWIRHVEVEAESPEHAKEVAAESPDGETELDHSYDTCDWEVKTL